MLLTANKFIDIMCNYAFLKIEVTFLIFGFFMTTSDYNWNELSAETPHSVGVYRNCPKNKLI